MRLTPRTHKRRTDARPDFGKMDVKMGIKRVASHLYASSIPFSILGEISCFSPASIFTDCVVGVVFPRRFDVGSSRGVFLLVTWVSSAFSTPALELLAFWNAARRVLLLRIAGLVALAPFRLRLELLLSRRDVVDSGGGEGFSSLRRVFFASLDEGADVARRFLLLLLIPIAGGIVFFGVGLSDREDWAGPEVLETSGHNSTAKESTQTVRA
mmetsp:Transcript_32148/g.62123  ORF Transcript_32148/g.62123 Transcript_32148/m.62123 type:complete len:212 (+) Transcript_32148:147-782(+)